MQIFLDEIPKEIHEDILKIIASYNKLQYYHDSPFIDVIDISNIPPAFKNFSNSYIKDYKDLERYKEKAKKYDELEKSVKQLTGVWEK